MTTFAHQIRSMKKHLIALLFVGLTLVSCSEYQNILKSQDNNLKYDKAVDYFQAKKYANAIGLFDDISPAFRGTDRSELILNYLAQSYIGQKDYFSASDYYKTYIKSYPAGEYIQDARYMLGYCYYEISPDPRLDQTDTYQAIDVFQNYLDEFPQGTYATEASKYIDLLNDKLAKKAYLNAKLYYNLGTYMGDNYTAAIITADNALKTYPANKYREEFIYLVLQSKYEKAVLSTSDKINQRFQDVIDEYYNYTNEYPDGKHIKDATKIFNNAKKQTDNKK